MDNETEDRGQHLAKHTNAARAGLFAAAQDILATMNANGVDEAAACVMTGALEMAVQTWVQVAHQSGVTPGTSRQTLEKEVRRLYLQFLAIERQAPPPKPAIEA